MSTGPLYILPVSPLRFLLTNTFHENKIKPHKQAVIFLKIWCRARGICCLSRGVEVQTLLPNASCYQSHQGKHNIVKHWIECFTRMGKRQARLSLEVSRGPPRPQPAHGNWQLAYMHPSCATTEGLLFFPTGDRHGSGTGQVPKTHVLKKNEGVGLGSETGKEISCIR